MGKQRREHIVADHALGALGLGAHLLQGLLVSRHALGHVEGRHAQGGRGLLQLGLHLVHIGERAVARHGLDAAHVGAHRRLARDLQKADLGGIAHMAAAAQLTGKVARLHHAHDLAVLLAEQPRDAGGAGLLQRRLVNSGGSGAHDVLVGLALHLGQLLGRARLEMGEVEAQAIGTHVRAGLLHMVAEHAAQSGVQDMGGGVVALDGGATVRVHAGHHRIALGETGLLGAHRVHEQTLLGGLRVQHVKAPLAVLDDAGVPHFSAHLGVEGRGGQHHFAGLSRRQGAHALTVDDDGQHARLGGGGVVADELRGAELVQQVAIDAPVGGPGRLGVLRAGGAGALALGLHGGLECLHVHLHAAAFRNFLGHFHGEAVGVVQGEGLLPGEHVAL